MGIHGKYDVEKLLFCGQFVLGPNFIDELASWKRIKVGSAICLTIHPNLPTIQAQFKNTSITLLGYILDPDHPQATDLAIIEGLARGAWTSRSLDNWIEDIFPFGGRWILLIDDGKELRLFHDAAGLRQVFYTDTGYTRDLWCASQPGLIAKVLNLHMSQDALDFIHSDEFRNNKEYWWPGVSSPYKEIRHLLPNHYLNLITGECHRYWPHKDLGHLALNEAVGRISLLLRGLMKSAATRFDLALALTAGYDSRLLLASSREISNRVTCLTVRQLAMSKNHPDIQVPSRLCSRLGLRHTVVRASSDVDDKFAHIYKQNVTLAHDKWAPDAEAILHYNKQNKVAATGSVSELARCFYRLPNSAGQEITARSLCLLTQMGNSSFAAKYYEQWLAGLGHLHNVNVLDLLYWEHRAGNWLSMCQLEFGIAWKDIFTPFNCRALLIDMLSVDERYRRRPEYLLYKQLISSLWPNALSEPLNPGEAPSRRERVKSLIRKALVKAHLLQFVPKQFRRLGKKVF